MKKMMFLMLVFFLGISAGMNAQVTIGSETEPHAGAILDLESYSKGLKLPNVSLSNVAVFDLVTGADDETKLSATGIVVYNTNPAIINGQGRGLYVWDGVADSWSFAGLSGPVAVPVTSILVSAEGGATSVPTGGTLQFLFQIVPSNATNQNVSWSIDPTSVGGGSINADGFFTAGTAGTVVIKATATDGSGVYGLKQVTVEQAEELVSSVTVRSEGNAVSLNAGSTLQLYADVLEATATNKTVTWSIIEGNAADVNPTTGLVSGTKAGTVKVQALANDGSTKKGDITLTVLPGAGAGPEVGGMQTYCYPGAVGCWTITNSKLGTASRTTYSGHDSGERGYYYTWANAPTACPANWHVPNDTDWTTLKNYINGTVASAQEKSHWLTAPAFAGYTTDTFVGSWNVSGTWWMTSSVARKGYSSKISEGITGWHQYDSTPYQYYSVRCKKD